MYLHRTVPFGTEVTPLQGTSEARRTFRWSRVLPASWNRSLRLGELRSASKAHPYVPGAPSGLLGGTGWIVLPEDPARAVGVLPYASRIHAALDGSAGFACTAEVRPWVRLPEGSQVVLLPGATERIRHWCDETATIRRAWAWSLDLEPGIRSLVGLAWLGGERRIAVESRRNEGLSNVHLRIPDGVEPFCEASRISQCVRLGLSLGGLPTVARTPGRTVILELPEIRAKRDAARWLALATELASRHSLIVAHSTELPEELNEGLRALANRLSILALSRPEEILRLAGEVSVWIAPMGPAAILASQMDCPLVLLGAKDAGTYDFGLSGGAPSSPVRFLPRGKPSAGEVGGAVLDLAPHGM